jgi:hypothetical protein
MGYKSQHGEEKLHCIHGLAKMAGIEGFGSWVSGCLRVKVKDEAKDDRWCSQESVLRLLSSIALAAYLSIHLSTFQNL